MTLSANDAATAIKQLEALTELATRNYMKWTRRQLAENWEIVGDGTPIYAAHKLEMVGMTVNAELKDCISEPVGTQGWANEIGYYLERLVEDLDPAYKLELIAKGLEL